MAGFSTPIQLRISTPVGDDLMIVGTDRTIVGSTFVPHKRATRSKPSGALLRARQLAFEMAAKARAVR